MSLESIEDHCTILRSATRVHPGAKPWNQWGKRTCPLCPVSDLSWHPCELAGCMQLSVHRDTLGAGMRKLSEDGQLQSVFGIGSLASLAVFKFQSTPPSIEPCWRKLPVDFEIFTHYAGDRLSFSNPNSLVCQISAVGGDSKVSMQCVAVASWQSTHSVAWDLGHASFTKGFLLVEAWWFMVAT